MVHYQKSIPRSSGCEFMINMVSIAIILLAVSNPINAIAGDYCTKKAEFIENLFDNRDNFTKDEMLKAIVKQWEDTGKEYPWYLVVEMQRMINNVYRADNDGNYRITDRDKLLSWEKLNCSYYGF